MPGGFPAFFELANSQNVGANPALSHGITITAGVANTKGSYTELIASTPYDSSYILVYVYNLAGGGWASATDIAMGANGAEQVIINNLIATSTTGPQPTSIALPMSIPAGSRLAAKTQSDAAGETVACNVVLFDGGVAQGEGFAGVDSIGFVAASSDGTAIDAGAAANTKGAYVQLIASTVRDYCGFFVSPDPNQSAPAAPADHLVDIAVGASTAEQVIVSNLTISRNVQLVGPTSGPYWINIPAGSRVSARSQSNITTTPGRVFGLTLYGIYL